MTMMIQRKKIGTWCGPCFCLRSLSILPIYQEQDWDWAVYVNQANGILKVPLMKPSQGCYHRISNIMLAILTNLFFFIFLFFHRCHSQYNKWAKYILAFELSECMLVISSQHVLSVPYFLGIFFYLKCNKKQTFFKFFFQLAFSWGPRHNVLLVKANINKNTSLKNVATSDKQ